jgi:nucleotide-binding universal stress UspA family protein
VVVGVDLDGSPDALAFAFDVAARRAMPLHAVLCWHPDWLAEMMWRPAQPAPNWLTVLLDEHLAPYVDKYPDVVVHSGVERQHAGDALVVASAGQALLVVGAKSRHPHLGTMLGSVSQGVLHHATCPVAVVR